VIAEGDHANAFGFAEGWVKGVEGAAASLPYAPSVTP
jgi:hypothetical protein